MNDTRKRHGCVSAWLWLAIIANSANAIFNVASMFDASSKTNVLGFGLLAILSTVCLLGSIMLMRWNKRGFYIFLISSVLSAVVNVGMMNEGTYLFVSSISSIIIWWSVLQIKKDGVPAWKLLDDDWDYKHCRHLYQFFGGVIVVLLVMTIFTLVGNNANNSRNEDHDGSDTIRTENNAQTPAEPDVKWHTFTDDNKLCSIEAPNDFRKAELSKDQILGLMCTDYDPAVIVISETINSLKSSGISTTKDYANVIVKMNRNVDGTSEFTKISEGKYGDDSYLIVYTMNVDGTKFRYSLLASKTKTHFYYCQVYCIDDYSEKLEPIISHMLSSFKTMK